MKFFANRVLWALAGVKNACLHFVAPKKVDAHVISVGNLSCGGTGKTSFAQWLVKKLPECAVLIRGYKSSMEHHAPNLINEKTEVSACGDEAALIARMGEKPAVYVGKNRRESAQMAVGAGYRFLVLDDGMQYRYLHRDVEIVMVPGKDPFGGWMREHPRQLKRADLVVIMGGDDENDRNMLLKVITRYTDAPVCGMRYKLPNLSGKKIAAFCALGNPDRFFEDLKRAGADVIATKTKKDHCPFEQDELKEFAKEANKAEMLVCTEKDWIKLPPIDLPVHCISAELECVFGQEHLERIVYEIMD